jgi:integrase
VAKKRGQHQSKRLTAKMVENATSKLCDGGGLWLQVSKKYRTKSWLHRFTFDGAEDSIGYGSIHNTSLAEARRLRDKSQALINDGINPREERDRLRRVREEERAKALTFRQCADAVIERDKGSWKNRKHLVQWLTTIEKTTAPINAELVKEIDKHDVLRVIKPLWLKTPESARRVRARIETILAYAESADLRPPNSNPATMEVLAALLPKHQKVAKRHFAALPYADVPAFMMALRERRGVSARCLEFLILTAARPNEALGAQWSEIDLNARTWTIPAERMKASAEHVVPLCDRAMAILEGVPRVGDLVFPGQRGKLSDQSLRDMAASISSGGTVQGFRSSFRDWCGNETATPREIAEAALAHKVSNAVEQAYRRESALEKRRKLMQDWADYCAREPAKVIALLHASASA